MKLKDYKIEDAQHKNEVIVSWIITHACQENCGYCISPNKKSEITDLATHMLIQNKMISNGVSKIRYIGGEPLLVKHLDCLIREASNSGIDTRLSTNGIALTQERFDQIKDSLNSVAFPYESLNDDLNKYIRCSNNHSQIITDRIKMAKQVKGLGVLVNTCVHKENIDYLEDLAYHLNDLGVDQWKLRKFSNSSGRGAVKNSDRFDITEEEFNNVVNKLKSKGLLMDVAGRLPKKIYTRLMISPQGELYRMVGKEEDFVHYGNIVKDDLNIKKIYERDRCD